MKSLEKGECLSLFCQDRRYFRQLYGLISPDGERTMGTFLGPAPTITPDEITEEMLSSYQCIYIEGYLLVNEELVRTTMQKAKKLGLKVALDLSNFNIVNAFRGLLDDIIPQYVDILFSNESEAEAFTGLKAHEAVKALSEQVEISLVTLGKEGAWWEAKGRLSQSRQKEVNRSTRRGLAITLLPDSLRAVGRCNIGAVGPYRLAFGRLHH